MTLNDGLGVVASYDKASVDAFARLRVSEPYGLLSLKQIYDGLPLFYDDRQMSGSGTTATHSVVRASTTIAVSASTAGRRVKQSKTRGYYQPGKGFLFLATAVVGSTSAGLTKRVGYFDDNNGLFFQSKDGDLSVVRRSYGTGTLVDTAVAQDDWNLDPLDGTGPSGVTLDMTKTNIFVIDFEWLGVGRVRMGVNVDGMTYYCHEFRNANNLTVVYMSNPNLPIRYEIINDGTGAASSMECICATLISEGGQEDISKSTHVSRSGTAQTLANQDLYTPIISVRLKTGNYSTGVEQLSTRVNPLEIDVFATSTTNYEWRLFFNPSVSGTDNASWVGVDNSSIEYDISRNTTNTVSGGYVVAGGYGSSTAQSRSATIGNVKTFLTLGSTAAGVSDEFVLAVANIDANGGTVYGGITLGEFV